MTFVLAVKKLLFALSFVVDALRSCNRSVQNTILENYAAFNSQRLAIKGNGPHDAMTLMLVNLRYDYKSVTNGDALSG